MPMHRNETFGFESSESLCGAFVVFGAINSRSLFLSPLFSRMKLYGTSNKIVELSLLLFHHLFS